MLPGTPRTFLGSTTFTVRGLTDASDRRTLVELVAAVPGVASVVVDVATGVVEVRASALVDRADVAAAVAEAGFVLVP